jgi:aspartyl-tRNA(Asn)/glutamyl-tRNA(Gln) amidotransferase subunit A
MTEKSLTLTEYLAQVQAGTIDPKTIVLQYVEKIKKENADLFSFVRIHDNYIQQQIDQLVQRPLKGAPIGIKDNIMLEGEITSCGSKMLEQYVAPYTATCVSKLIEAGALPIGKTNMDEFAMGSSTEHSAF